MKCPSCNSELVKKKYEKSVEIDSCNQCHGMWLDAGELEKIQGLKINDYQKNPDLVGNAINLALAKNKPHINCPICDTELNRREYGYTSQILIDTCINGHGIWLDKNEIKALEIFYERSRNEAKKDDAKREKETAADDHFLANLFNFFK